MQFQLIDKLYDENRLSAKEYSYLIENRTEESSAYLFKKATCVREMYYGRDVYIRGLIEFSSYCKNDCFYCGIRKGNARAERYRLNKSEILDCCKKGYELGFRTFVLQSGEDSFFTDTLICDIVSSIKNSFPGCAVTLSAGEKSPMSYREYFRAGADRYLLRHETADPAHYSKLHPRQLSAENRKRCLYELKAIGYQAGTGFMVGSPFQTANNLADDMLFIKELQPHMVGIGPFIPHKNTPFSDFTAGTVELTLFMLGLIRLTLPKALIPSTTALATLDPCGREKGILAGANVIMPNLTPIGSRKKYSLYDNKACSGIEDARNLCELKKRIAMTGYRLAVSRGDFIDLQQ